MGEVTAAVGTCGVVESRNAVSAPGAFERADEHVRIIDGEVAITALAVRSDFEHRQNVALKLTDTDARCRRRFPSLSVRSAVIEAGGQLAKSPLQCPCDRGHHDPGSPRTPLAIRPHQILGRFRPRFGPLGPYLPDAVLRFLDRKRTSGGDTGPGHGGIIFSR